jgi:hypothetical protein
VGGVARGVQAVEGDVGQAGVDVAVGDPLHGLRVELRVGPVLAELPRPAEFQRQVPGADERDPQVAGPGADDVPQGPAELDEPFGPGEGRREDVRVHRHHRQVIAGADGEDGARDGVVHPQLVGVREVEAGVQAATQDMCRQFLVPAQQQPGQPELAFLVVVVGVVEGCLAHQKLRHVVQPELVEVVRADHDQHVGPGPGQRFPVGLDLAYPFGREGRRLLWRQLARGVEERMMRGGQDRDQFRHNHPPALFRAAADAAYSCPSNGE